MPSKAPPAGSIPPNAHYIFPANQGANNCAVLFSGDEDQYTGRDRILSATRLTSATASRSDGKASSVPSAKSDVRTRQLSSTPGIELMDAPPSRHKSAPMLEYHVKYANGFVFVFNMSSRDALELVEEMLDAVMQAATVLGLVGRGHGPVSVPVVLVGNAGENQHRREDDPKDTASPRAQDQDNAVCIRREAAMLAERWRCELFEVDTSKGDISSSADEAFSALLRRIEEAKRLRGSGFVYGFSEVKVPQRLLVRRTVGRILPGALLKLFAK
ncbi:hypothetical protein Daus18300_001954 [Diaporthe australafricana]|uniref:Ras family protein n=1 Tax=Diaporthe australafricana TaxID=127596 RepID=A0ABR3XRS5_9PEZI